HGPISVHVFAMPIIGLPRSSRENPTARSIARAGARFGPSVNGMELCFACPLLFSLLMRALSLPVWERPRRPRRAVVQICRAPPRAAATIQYRPAPAADNRAGKDQP